MSDTEKITGNLQDLSAFRRRAEKVAGEFETWSNHFRLRSVELKNLFAQYKFSPDDTVLEIGSGNAFSAAAISQFVKRVVASDLPRLNYSTHSIGMNKAKQFLNAMEVKNCTLVGCSGEELPFRERSFDKVVLIFVMEHIPDRKKALKEIARVLKDSGEVILVIPSFLDRFIHPFAYYKDLFIRGKNKLKKILSRNNEIGNESTLDSGNSESPRKRFRENYPHFPLPEPHGAYKNFSEELVSCFPWNWVRLFEQSGFKVVQLFSTMLTPRSFLSLFIGTAALSLYERLSPLEERLGGLPVIRKLGQNLCVVCKKDLK